LNYFKKILDQIVCLDSGGPLVTGANTQIGILSWGVLPCGSGFPDGFDRVADFRTWILNNAV
jgi:secreted trypsin-like serine protease